VPQSFKRVVNIPPYPAACYRDRHFRLSFSSDIVAFHKIVKRFYYQSSNIYFDEHYLAFTKVATALKNSGVQQQMLWLRFSSSIASSKDDVFRFCLMAVLVNRRPKGVLASSVRAVSMAAGITWSEFTKRLIKPILSASWASTVLPVIKISEARALPTMRGRK
jgi:hypothetical protein